MLPRLLAFSLGFASLLAGCSSQPNQALETVSETAAPTTVPADNSAAYFVDVAARSGLNFKHDLGETGRFYFVEFTAPGCAFIDFDGDGFLDIFLIQSGSSEPPATVKNRPFCALYRNQRDGTFQDVTAGSGLDKNLGYAQGAAVGDYDNDGRDDLFVTAYGGNHLLRNLGDGKFADVTQSSGLAKIYGSGFATSAAWGDYDADGRLDLYVAYYANWSHATDKECRDDVTGLLDYCHPQLYDPVSDRLYRNTPRGFVDVSERAGITKAKGRGLAVAWTDYDNDNRPDIFVANDVTPNMLWRNNGDGTFANAANRTGVDYDGEGQGIAAMGIGVSDYDRSGRSSLYISNFAARPNILFKNVGGSFEDATAQARLAFSNLKYLSFGCDFLDYDADGWPDLIVNNGHVQMQKNKREPGVALQQPKQLYQNEKGQFFREITEPSLLGDLKTPTLGRGLATGDFDNDGRIDALAMSQNASPQLFHNQLDNANHWISFRTVGTKSNRNGIHAKFELRAGGARQSAEVHSGTSYLSSSDRRIYFGLGAAAQVEQLVIIWPSGTREVLKNLRADRFYTVTEGKGITAEDEPAEAETAQP